MSAEAAGWVYRHSPYEGATFAVHCAVADTANDQYGHEIFFAVATLAAKARCSPSTVKIALRKLVDDGFLESLDEPGKARAQGRPNRFRFVFVDEAPVVFETRGGSRPRPTPVADHDLPGSRPSATKPKGTQEEAQEANSVAEAPEQGKLVDVPKKPRPRNELFDAIAAVFPTATESERKRVAKVVAELRKLDPVPSPDDVRRRAEWVRREWPTASPMAISSAWSRIGETLGARDVRAADPVELTGGMNQSRGSRRARS